MLLKNKLAIFLHAILLSNLGRFFKLNAVKLAFYAVSRGLNILKLSPAKFNPPYFKVTDRYPGIH